MYKQLEFLMIENDVSDIHFTQEHFKQHYLTNCLKVVNNCNEAMDLLCGGIHHTQAKVYSPDIILINIRLLCNNTAYILPQLKSHAERQQILIVGLTSTQGEEKLIDETSFIRFHFMKPFNLEHVFSIIKQLPQFGALIVKSNPAHVC